MTTSNSSTPVSPQPALLLNTEKIRARRLELGLSERQLAARLGVSFTPAVLRGLERGINHPDLTLGELTQLGTELAMPVSEMLATTARRAGPVGPQSHGDWLQAMVADLGAMLCELRRAVPESVVAELLGLSLEQVSEVVTELATRSSAIGMQVVSSKHGLAMRPSTAAAATGLLQGVWKRHLARRGLDIGQAHLVSRVLRGRGWPSNPTADDQLRGASLINAGVLRAYGDRAVDLHPDVRFSLLLD